MRRPHLLAAALLAVSCLTVSTAVASTPSSGMLLGVYAFPNYLGLRVTGTISGYSAEGRIFRNDVLLRVTADGQNVYPTRNHHEIEFAKDQIGPFQQAALEVYRPGVGNVYLWVEFRPVGLDPAAYALRSADPQQPIQMEARILTEREKPGASRLFRRGR